MTERPTEKVFESAIYQGFVRHRRFSPKRHEFKNSLMMMLIKLDEVEQLQKTFWQFGNRALSWVRLKRQDYIGDDSQTISQAVKDKMAELLPDSPPPEGEVFLLGQLRYFGFYFSPLNLYYLRQQGHFRYLLAEVSNTPWNERHYYLIDLDNIQPHDKAFHVSPFNPMQQRYHWRITPPRAQSSKTMLHLESYDSAGEQDSTMKVFDATMVLKRLPMNQSQLNRVLINTPLQTVSIVIGIYWQAMKLLLKRLPLYPHPENKSNKQGKDLT